MEAGRVFPGRKADSGKEGGLPGSKASIHRLTLQSYRAMGLTSAP